jgi:branched-subunit amino acid aminotransferase/4-amino-4-deoxychorismate lyase
MTSIPIAILTSQGITDAPYSAASLADAANLEPQGVYTVARTFKRISALLLDDHLNRLEQSAQLEGMTIHLDRKALRSLLRMLIEQSGYQESRYRLTIPYDHPDHVIVSLEALKPVPADIIAHGARVITLHIERHNPVAKTTAWMTARKSAVESFSAGIYEGILVSPDGLLLEGTSSNFYAITHNTLKTADETMVLSGIARRLVLIIAPPILPVEFNPIHIDEIGGVQETFLTSSGRGVVPVIEIDGRKIGDGQPGPYTKQLRAAYDQWADEHLEPI